MDTRTTDRNVIEKVLADDAAIPYACGRGEDADDLRSRAGSFPSGAGGHRRGGRRVHGSLVHIDIVSDQVIIQRDGTECGVAPLLARGGIAPERIVLAFRPEGPFLYSEVEAA